MNLLSSKPVTPELEVYFQFFHNIMPVEFLATLNQNAISYGKIIGYLKNVASLEERMNKQEQELIRVYNRISEVKRTLCAISREKIDKEKERSDISSEENSDNDLWDIKTEEISLSEQNYSEQYSSYINLSGQLAPLRREIDSIKVKITEEKQKLADETVILETGQTKLSDYNKLECFKLINLEQPNIDQLANRTNTLMNNPSVSQAAATLAGIIAVEEVKLLQGYDEQAKILLTQIKEDTVNMETHNKQLANNSIRERHLDCQAEVLRAFVNEYKMPKKALSDDRVLSASQMLLDDAKAMSTSYKVLDNELNGSLPLQMYQEYQNLYGAGYINEIMQSTKKIDLLHGKINSWRHNVITVLEVTNNNAIIVQSKETGDIPFKFEDLSKAM